MVVVVVQGMVNIFRKGSRVLGDWRLGVIVSNFLAWWAVLIRREQWMGRWGTLELAGLA